MTRARTLSLVALALAACPRRPAPRRVTPDATVVAVRDVAAPAAPADAPALHDSRLVIPPGEGPPCAEDSDCRVGRCLNANLEAQYSRVFRDCPDAHAWRAARRPGTCVVNACDVDADCPAKQRCSAAQMVPFPQRVCLPAGCRSDADCAVHGRLGQCVPYLAGRPCEHGGWACLFPDDPCSPVEPARRCRPVDGVIAYCIPVDERFRCVAEDAPLP